MKYEKTGLYKKWDFLFFFVTKFNNSWRFSVKRLILYYIVWFHLDWSQPAAIIPILGLWQGWGFCGFFLICGFFWAANAGLWMGTYQLQEIAWNLDLSRVEVEWNLPCHRTGCCFFFSKSVPIPVGSRSIICSFYEAICNSFNFIVVRKIDDEILKSANTDEEEGNIL